MSSGDSERGSGAPPTLVELGALGLTPGAATALRARPLRSPDGTSRPSQANALASRSMSGGVRFEHRMSDSDALMWHIEKDPLLRSTITVLWWLDRMPDRSRLEDKIERATRLIPRLRQRVVPSPYSIATPRWEIDPILDRRCH